MIRRDDGNDWLLISQVDHAHLAAEIAAAWGNDDVRALPACDLLIPAIHFHDSGWFHWELRPGIEASKGVPRDFTEMPMAVATEIWNKSIEICSQGGTSFFEAGKRFRRILESRGLRLTRERRSIADAVFRFEGTFYAYQVIDRAAELRTSVPVRRATVDRILPLLEDAGLIQRIYRGIEVDCFEVTLPNPEPSPLAGIWVSRHFCWLAERARENRSENVADLAAIETFLAEQASLQLKWREDVSKSFAAEQVDTLSDAGFRYLQFFDRLSLWLCCAHRTQAYRMTAPNGGTLCFVPCVSGRILLEPYPLSVERLKLAVPALRIPARKYTNDSELQQAIARGLVEPLEWELSR